MKAWVTPTAIFRPGKKYLETKIFRDVTTVLNKRNHLKIVFRSVQDSVILFLDRSKRPVRVKPLQLTLVATPSPVLQTDASARSLRWRSRRSHSAVSLLPSSASCFAGPQPTHASSEGSCGCGEVHTPAGRCHQ